VAWASGFWLHCFGVTQGGDDQDDQVQALQERERFLASILENAPDYILQIDRAGTLRYISRPPPGRTTGDMLGIDVRTLMEPSAHAAFEQALAEVLSTGEPRSYESVGTVTGRNYENRIAPVRRGGQVESAVLITHDITERKRAEQALRESEERFRALVEGGFEGLMISEGPEARILVANAAIGSILRVPVEEVIGRHARDFCTPESLLRVVEIVRAGLETPYEVVGVRPDGTTFPCEVLGRNITYQGRPARMAAFRDVSERERLRREHEALDEQMRRAQKLESLGVLAGGIAHDFNNLLATVLANADVALRDSTLSPTVASRLSEMRAAALRGRELTEQLLSYAARGPITMEPLDLSHFVREAISLLGVTLSPRTQLRLELCEQPCVIEGDRSQLKQLLLNLVMNAVEALPSSAGRVAITTTLEAPTREELEACYWKPQSLLPRAVVLRVLDTGEGMSAETLAHIFDPFFTTKFTGRGLGLASVLSIVRGHGGAIAVRSEPGRGSELTVYLPLSDKPAISHVPAPAPASSVQARQRVVLVADDERMLRNVASEILASLGYEVLLAADGEEAIKVFDASAEQLTLLLLDLTMPKRSGIDVLRHLRTRGSTVPAICTSGFGAEDLRPQLASDPRTRFLAKPYSLSELSSLVEVCERMLRSG
jgi:two-component system, cell cycle sensor histidine kinase and response regulator CckA